MWDAVRSMWEAVCYGVSLRSLWCVDPPRSRASRAPVRVSAYSSLGLPRQSPPKESLSGGIFNVHREKDSALLKAPGVALSFLPDLTHRVARGRRIFVLRVGTACARDTALAGSACTVSIATCLTLPLTWGDLSSLAIVFMADPVSTITYGRGEGVALTVVRGVCRTAS